MKPAKVKAVKPTTKKKGVGQGVGGGRPSKYTPAILTRIVDGLSEGIPLTVICSEKGMPHDNTVRDWINAKPEVSVAIARARDRGFDKIALDALRIADSPLIGEEITESEDGMQIKRSDMLGHRKLQIETRLKLLAKWDPKRYGERMTQEISGPDGGPVTLAAVRLNDEQEQALARVIEDARERVKRIP